MGGLCVVPSVGGRLSERARDFWRSWKWAAAPLGTNKKEELEELTSSNGEKSWGS